MILLCLFQKLKHGWFLRQGPKSWFLGWHPRNKVESDTKKVKFSYVSNYISQNKSKNFDMLYIDEVKVFCPGPMVSIQSARKVSSYLVRAKFTLERTVSSFKCDRSRSKV